jgi:hypothetical protein
MLGSTFLWEILGGPRGGHVLWSLTPQTRPLYLCLPISALPYSGTLRNKHDPRTPSTDPRRGVTKNVLLVTALSRRTAPRKRLASSGLAALIRRGLPPAAGSHCENETGFVF